MAITFDNPTSRSAYSWIGEWQLNPTWNGIDPETKYLKDAVTGKFIPKNLDISKPLWREAYINDVNGNSTLNWKPLFDANGNLILNEINAPVIDKDWTFALVDDPKIPNQNVAPPHSVDMGKVQQVSQQWGNVIDFTGTNKNISFAYVDGGGNNLGTSSGRTYVGSDGTRNVIFLNSAPAQYDLGIKTSDISLGTWGGWTVMHELGHVWGLEHPNNNANQQPELLKMSIMWYPNQDGPGSFNDPIVKIPLTPGMTDIATLQSRFGQSHAQDGNTTYTFGQGSVDLGHGNILDGIIGANLNNYVMTIWDRPTTTDPLTGKVDTAGGIDTIDASSLATKTYIDLRAGHFSAIGTNINTPLADGDNGNTDYNVGIAKGAEIENAKGGAVDDYIRGNDLANVLEGNGGNDTLQGGVGNDTLDGGSGFDTYILEGLFKMATIKDNDGQGSITLDSHAIFGASKQILQDIYHDEGPGKKNYIKLSDGGLLVAGAGGEQNIYIQQWNSNNLGISLSGEVAAAPIATGQMLGDFKKKIDDKGTTDTNDDTYVIENNNYVNDGAQAGALDLITGTAGNDVIDGKTGDDALIGKAGDDYILGGTGSDYILGGTGKDTLIGGDGDDHIYGSEDGDLSLPISANYTPPNNLFLHPQSSGFNWTSGYYTTYSNDVPKGFTTDAPRVWVQEADGNQIDGGTGIDFIAAGTGADYVHGGADMDLIWGMGKADILFGDAGNDVIFGDGDFQDGTSSVGAEAENHGNDIIDGGDGDDIIYGQGGNDIIFGGNDNDKIWGDDPLFYTDLAGDDFLFGGTGNDTLTGGKGNDYLDGGTENDTLVGDAGDDTLIGGLGADILQGGADKDTLIGSGDDILQGGADDDTYYAQAGDNIADIEGHSNINITNASGVSGTTKPTVSPTADASLNITLDNGTTLSLQGALYGMDASLQFAGGTAIDVESWVSTNLTDAVRLNLANIVLGSGAVADHAFGGAGGDQIAGGIANDTIKGYAGNDTLVGGAGNDSLLGGAGNDQVQGDAGDDVLDGGDGDDALLGLDGNDNLLGGAGNDELQGNLGNDILNGGTGSDTLFGQAGSDTLEGGVGNDVLLGNAGNDVYLFNLGGGQDTIWEEGDTAGDVLRFGTGIVASDILYTYNNGGLVLTHSNGIDQVTVANWLVNTSYQLSKIEFSDGTFVANNAIVAPVATVLRGTAVADVFFGTSYPVVIFGLEGDDDITGSDYNDTLVGGQGYDEIWGAGGYDTYKFGLGDGFDDVYADNSDTIRFLANIQSAGISVERIDSNLVLSYANGVDGITVINWYASASNQVKEVIFEADGVTWSGAQLSVMGTNINHSYTLSIGDGAKTINDWGGTDGLIFGAGIADSDILITRAGADLVLSHNNGMDSVSIIGWFNDIAKQIETILFTDSGNTLTANQLITPFLTITGTATDDILIGTNLYGETISGLAGNDRLYGMGGNDTISGGDDTDYLSGDAGNDVLLGDAGIDTIYGGLGDDTLIGGELSGDHLYGGYGADTYIFSSGDGYENIYENGDTSHTQADRILFVSGILPANIQISYWGVSESGLNIYLPNFMPIHIHDQFINPSYAIEYLEFADGNKIGLIDLQITTGGGVFTGTSGDSCIIGDSAADTFYGGAGNDWLDGQAGANSLFGGTGNDLYKVNYRTDVVTELVNEGTDTIYSSIAYTLGANIESLTLTGTASINGNGNALDNVFRGNSAANAFTGGAGNDTYYISTGDSAVEAVSAGTDVVYTDATYIMGTNIENGYIIGAAAVNLTGNALANIITGNAAANILNGGAGADALTGGLGDDTYVIDVAADVVTENANEGNDTVQVTYATTVATTLITGVGKFTNVENITITGTGLYNLTGDANNNTLIGNASANVLIGNAGNDVLNGLAGNDDMRGGLGYDTYTIDVLTDVITENFNEGTDLVNVAIATRGGTYTLATNFENALLTNTVAYNLAGNALNNTLIGNGANNILTGAAGTDVLTGGLGADTFDFNAILESLVGTSRDVITDFSRVQTDKIDLSTIDANTALANDQAFLATILTSGAFTAAGQLRLVGNILSGNTDSNFATTEFEIQLTGVTTLAANDFVL